MVMEMDGVKQKKKKKTLKKVSLDEKCTKIRYIVSAYPSYQMLYYFQADGLMTKHLIRT